MITLLEGQSHLFSMARWLGGSDEAQAVFRGPCENTYKWRMLLHRFCKSIIVTSARMGGVCSTFYLTGWTCLSIDRISYMDKLWIECEVQLRWASEALLVIRSLVGGHYTSNVTASFPVLLVHWCSIVLIHHSFLTYWQALITCLATTSWCIHWGHYRFVVVSMVLTDVVALTAACIIATQCCACFEFKWGLPMILQSAFFSKSN